LIFLVFTIKKGGVIRRFPMLQLTATALLGLGACSVIPSTPQAAKPKSPAPSPTSSCWSPWKILSRKRIPPPPKAAPLLEVGTIRSISEDGSYAIIELAPGTLVRSGEPLLVTSKDHPVSRLKVAEVQPPCFAAEVEQGSVSPGDLVKR